MISSAIASQALQWFALRVKSNRERVTSLALSGKGYDVFLPTYQRADSEREWPLFPGYLFSRFDANDRLPILVVPGIVHIVGLGSTPIPVDEDELESVRILIKSAVALNPSAPFSLGEFVRVISGPLSGAQGCVTGVANQRLVVTITLLQRSVSVELNPRWIIASQGGNRMLNSAGQTALPVHRALTL